MLPVKTLPHIFDPKRLFQTIQQVATTVQDEFDHHGQLSITNSTGDAKDLFDGVGSLYDYNLNKFTRFTSDFTKINPLFANTYVQEVCTEVERVATIMGVKIGRTRLMCLNPKTCYTYHTDPEEFRYHIPLQTNYKCMFIVDDVVYKMSQVGTLYRFRTDKIHTAVNASTENRYHIVFDTYK